MAGDRSPNYPTISLPDAVSRAQQIYEKERTHAADKEVVAKALGYGTINGASASVISALRKFGLLSAEGNQLKVSVEALDIVLHTTAHPDRASAVQRVAFLPPLFSELRATFGKSLPSDENMKAFLIKKGFNPNTVGHVIRSYRETVDFVDAETRQLDVEATSGGPLDGPEAPQAPAPAPIASTARPSGTRGIGSITMIPELSGREGLDLAFNLTADCHAHLHFTGEVTQLAIRKLFRFLELSMDTFPDGEVSVPSAIDEAAFQES